MVNKSDPFEIDKTRKHYEPRFYLRGFSPDGHALRDKVHVFDKYRPEFGVKLRSVENVSVSRHAYTMTDDAHLTALEVGFKICLDFIVRRVEKDGDFPIRTQKGSGDLLGWMANFLLISLLRSSGNRSPDNPAMQSLFQESARQFKGRLDKLRLTNLEWEKELRKNGLEYETLRDQFLEEFGLENIRKFIPIFVDPLGRSSANREILSLIKEGSWRFYRAAQGRSFITSDRPATSFRLGLEPEYRDFIMWGMPLSKNVAVSVLCGDGSDPTGTYPLRGVYEIEKHLDMYNMCQYAVAHRFVYASSKNELIRACRWHESGLSPLTDILPDDAFVEST